MHHSFGAKIRVLSLISLAQWESKTGQEINTFKQATYKQIISHHHRKSWQFKWNFFYVT